jgi:hypothetical protein
VNSTAEHSLAELSPVMMIPRLMAMDHDRKMQEDYRRRTFDGHELTMATLGFKPSPMTKDEEMGDINVANHYYGQSASQMNTDMVPAPVAAAPAKKKVTNEDIQKYIKRKIAEGLAKQPPAPAPAPLQPTAIVPPAQDPWWKRYVMPAIVGTAIGGTGLGAAALLNRPTPTVDTDTQYKFQISSGKGTGFSTDAEVKLPAPKQ